MKTENSRFNKNIEPSILFDIQTKLTESFNRNSPFQWYSLYPEIPDLNDFEVELKGQLFTNST
jgi:hypothetical protein